jgi:hypothetical protein
VAYFLLLEDLLVVSWFEDHDGLYRDSFHQGAAVDILVAPSSILFYRRVDFTADGWTVQVKMVHDFWWRLVIHLVKEIMHHLEVLGVLNDKSFVLLKFIAYLLIDILELLDDSFSRVFEVVDNHIDKYFVHF